jgi:hypothetical protein
VPDVLPGRFFHTLSNPIWAFGIRPSFGFQISTLKTIFTSALQFFAEPRAGSFSQREFARRFDGE